MSLSFLIHLFCGYLNCCFWLSPVFEGPEHACFRRVGQSSWGRSPRFLICYISRRRKPSLWQQFGWSSSFTQHLQRQWNNLSSTLVRVSVPSVCRAKWAVLGGYWQDRQKRSGQKVAPDKSWMRGCFLRIAWTLSLCSATRATVFCWRDLKGGTWKGNEH